MRLFHWSDRLNCCLWPPELKRVRYPCFTVLLQLQFLTKRSLGEVQAGQVIRLGTSLLVAEHQLTSVAAAETLILGLLLPFTFPLFVLSLRPLCFRFSRLAVGVLQKRWQDVKRTIDWGFLFLERDVYVLWDWTFTAEFKCFKWHKTIYLWSHLNCIHIKYMLWLYSPCRPLWLWSRFHSDDTRRKTYRNRIISFSISGRQRAIKDETADFVENKSFTWVHTENGCNEPFQAVLTLVGITWGCDTHLWTITQKAAAVGCAAATDRLLVPETV